MTDSYPPPPVGPPQEPTPPHAPEPAAKDSRNSWFAAAVVLSVVVAVSATATVMLLRDRSNGADGATATTPATSAPPVAPTAPAGGDELSTDRSAVLDQLLESSEQEGIPTDEACLRAVVAQLSDDDARLLAESGIDDARVSDRGDELAVELFGCVPAAWWIDQISQELGSEGLTVDRDCLERELESFDFRELGRALREGGAPPAQLTQAGLDCAR